MKGLVTCGGGVEVGFKGDETKEVVAAAAAAVDGARAGVCRVCQEVGGEWSGWDGNRWDSSNLW